MQKGDKTLNKGDMIDPFGRTVSYLRVSLTDRCDFRCVYCMAEDMTFLPKADLLSLEEMERLCKAFIRMGVKKLRLTGGEPLVRRNAMDLISRLGQQLGQGLEELTLTTNGSQLAKYAKDLAGAGIRRINVSLDTLDAHKFAAITRWGRLDQVMQGIEAARDAGLAIKINMVALKGVNDDEFDDMLRWCGAHQMDLCLIETMPMGEVTRREETHLRLDQVRADLELRWTFVPSSYVTGGPARYDTVLETGCRVGFITPFSHNFCESCNRVRLTCTGRLYLCLGQEDSVDLRTTLRLNPDDNVLEAAIRRAINIKPKGHDFVIGRVAVPRHMSLTGG